MPPRLAEIYRPGDEVEVYFSNDEGDMWQAGTVIAMQSPGVWVRTEDGAPWFVTNGRRIRLLRDRPADSSRA